MRPLSRLLALALLGFGAACSGAPTENAQDYEVVGPAGDKGDRDNATGGEEPAAGDRGPDAIDADGAEPTKPAAGTADAGAVTGPPMATGWCVTRRATFCADFDSAALPSSFATMDGASLSIGEAATRPLILDLAAAAASAPYTSKLTHVFEAPSSDMSLELDISPMKLSRARGSLLVAALDFGVKPAARYSLRIVYHEGRVRLEENTTGTGSVLHPFFAIPPNTWTRFRLDVSFAAGTGGTAKLLLADKLVGTTRTIKTPPGMDRRPTLLVGAVYGTSPHSGWKIGYDNITMDLR